MLKGKLIHPQILEALGRAGHGSKILIADGNYPFATAVGPQARQVFLNLSPGLVPVTAVLDALVPAIPIEAAAVMMPPGDEPAIFAEFRALLPPELELQALDRFAFYAAARDESVALLVATGEQRVYANILLTIGVVHPGPATE
ncbi:MAG TPA: RbsD/FucU family protein [Chloroflexia bacterium]|jgi:L-fucose mutarotase|nr:RbsD/FucU family protein [Chloroflexia bacterium]